MILVIYIDVFVFIIEQYTSSLGSFHELLIILILFSYRFDQLTKDNSTDATH